MTDDETSTTVSSTTITDSTGTHDNYYVPPLFNVAWVVDCPYYDDCRSRGTGKCQNCRHNKNRDYYEPVSPNPYRSPYRYVPEWTWREPIITCGWTHQ